MAALYTFLDGAFADIRSKLDREYQERLAAHEKTISEELSPEDYTPNYGKINIVDALSHFYNEHYSGRPPAPCELRVTRWYREKVSDTARSEVMSVVDTHPEGRWIVHYMPTQTTSTYQGSNSYGTPQLMTSCSYSISLIDNYGQMYYASYDHNGADMVKATSCRLGFNTDTTKYKYRLPNFLIDFCKSMKQDAFGPGFASDTGPNSLQLLAEQYYKRFVSMKPLFTSGRFTDYATLQAQKVDLEEQLAAASAKLQEATERITGLTGSLETATAENSALKRELAATRAQLTSETALGEKTKAAAATTATLLENTTAELAEEKCQKSALRFELDTTLRSLTSTQEELLAAKKQLDELRAENQRYVDTVFQQRQEITNYKKQLLEAPAPSPAPAAPALSPPNLEDLIAQAVKKMLTPTLEVSETLPKTETSASK
jgi:hypothetical protein